MRVFAYVAERILVSLVSRVNQFLAEFRLGSFRAIVATMNALEQELIALHASVCKGLADPKRLLLINALRDGERSVTELCEATGIAQANASQHLAILRDKGLVNTRRDGQRVFYQLQSDKITRAMDLLREVMADQMPTART
jgi:ArsR family transcriptional regulator